MINGFAPGKVLWEFRAALDALPEHRGGVGWGQPGAGGAEAASGRKAEPCALQGTGRLRQLEMQFLQLFGSELPARGLVQRQICAGPRAWQGSGSGCSRLPHVLFLHFSLTAEPWLGFAEAELQQHRKIHSGLRAEGWLTTDPGLCRD